MIQLYFRSLKAKKPEELERVAIDAAQFYRDQTNKIRTTFKNSSSSSIFITAFESHGIISNLSKPPHSLTILEAYLYAILTPYSVAAGSSSAGYIRAIISFFFADCPWSNYIRPILHFMRIPYRRHTYCISFSLSLYQALAIKASHGMKIADPSTIFDSLYQSVIIAFVHLHSQKIVAFLQKRYLKFIPNCFISLFISYITAPFILRLCRFGVRNTMQWILEAFIRFFMFNTENNLPDDYPIPDVLTCSICGELLKDPLELSGTFFCSSCLNRWFKTSLTNPYTGEMVSKEMISASLLMNSICEKYRRLALGEINARNRNQTNNNS